MRPSRSCAALVLCLASFAFAGKHAPLPQIVLRAKTIYILNETGEARLLDDCYAELTKWGRFQVAETQESADLVLVLTKNSTSSTSRGGTTKVWEPSANGGDGGYQNVYSGDETNTYVYVTLSLFDNQHHPLWSDTTRWKWIWSHPTNGVLKQLRQRIEEQEKASH
jgi:hypothetical protein